MSGSKSVSAKVRFETQVSTLGTFGLLELCDSVNSESFRKIKTVSKMGFGLTGSEAGLLLPLAQVRVGVKIRFQRRRFHRFTPAFPLDQMGHPALSHGRGLGHMVLDYLGNPCKREKAPRLSSKNGWCASPPPLLRVFPREGLDSPCREDRASAAIS